MVIGLWRHFNVTTYHCQGILITSSVVPTYTRQTKTLYMLMTGLISPTESRVNASNAHNIGIPIDPSIALVLKYVFTNVCPDCSAGVWHDW